jgi:hypothetical protein
MFSFKSPWVYPLAACFLLIFLFAFRQNIDYDMGFHLRAGQWILQNHVFPQKDTFTFTSTQNDYQDPHWLYQVICYLLYLMGGYSAIGFLHLVLILAAFGLTLFRMSLAKVPLWLCVLLLLPAVLTTEIRFLDRPEIVSWALLILTLLVLDLRWNRQRNLLYLLPLFQLLWVNIEGLFILGWVVMGAYLFSGWFHERRLDRSLLKCGLFSMAAAFVNPYFWKGVLFPFRLFTTITSSNVFKQYISELQPPWSIVQDPSVPFLPAIPLYTYRVFGLLLLGVVWLAFRRRKIHELFLAGVFFGLSVAAIRNIPLFFWVTLPIAAASLFDLSTFQLFAQKRDLFLRHYKTLPLTVAFLIVLTAARVLTGGYYVSDRRMVHAGLGMDPQRFPIQAVDFMAQNGLNGRVLNDLSYGGWLDWKGPGPLFIDGRLEVMGEDLFTEYRKSFYPAQLEPLLTTRDVQMVLADHMMDTSWTSQLGTDPQWRLLYFDAASALYARKDYRPDLASTSWQALLNQWGLQASPPDSILTGLAGKPASPLADWFSGFVVAQDYPMPLFRLGAFAYENGQFDAARSFFLEMLRRTQGRYFEVYFNLGATYERLGRRDLALVCYQKALALNPAYAPARQKLGQL